MASKIKVDQLEGSTGSTITVPTGQTLTITDGLAASTISSGTLADARLPTVPVTKGGTGLTSLGSAGQVVQVNSGGSALEFANASSGKIHQIVHTAYNGVQSTHDINNADRSTNFVVQITPSATNSTVLVQGHIQISMTSSYGGFGIWFTREVSGQSDVTVGTATGGNSQENYHSQSINTQTAGTNAGSSSCSPFMFTDSPNTTSQVTYRLRVRGVNGCGNITVGGNESSTGQKFITPFTATEIKA